MKKWEKGLNWVRKEGGKITELQPWLFWGDCLARSTVKIHKEGEGDLWEKFWIELRKEQQQQLSDSNAKWSERLIGLKLLYVCAQLFYSIHSSRRQRLNKSQHVFFIKEKVPLRLPSKVFLAICDTSRYYVESPNKIDSKIFSIITEWLLSINSITKRWYKYYFTFMVN